MFKLNSILAAIVIFGIANVYVFGEFSCVPNSTYKEDCNTCRCSENGKFAACTLMQCVTVTEQTKVVENPVCKPGETKMEQCNHCRCINDGSGWACTRKMCVDSQLQQRVERAAECQPGARWMHECNSCFCTETGVAACTLKGCLGKVDKKSKTSLRSTDTQQQVKTISASEFNSETFECQPGEHFKVDCNSCKCAADGKHARCSKKRCIPEEEV